MKTLFLLLSLSLAFPIFAQEQNLDWDTDRLALRLELEAEGAWYIRFSPDNSRLAALYRDRTIRIWDALNGELLKQFFLPIDDSLGQLAFSPNGEMLAVSTGYRLNAVYILDVDSGDILQTFSQMSSYDVAFTPDSQSLIVADWAAFYVWDVESGDKIFEKQFSMGSVSFRLSDRGDLLALAFGGVNSPLILYDTVTWTGLASFGFFTVDVGISVAIDSTNTLLASGHCESIAFWDISTDSQLSSLDEYSEPKFELPILEDCIQQVQFFAEDTILVAADFSTIQFWDIAKRELLYSKEGWRFTISPNGQEMAIINNDNIEIWSYLVS